MRINADYSERVVVESETLPWVPSPLAGVDRRMLERDGDEVARVTSIVRYAAGSHFTAHTHSGGEEFLVLSGVFSDEHGDFPAGTYVRNPVGSRHAPQSGPGTVILVKLWWMHPEDQEQITIDTGREAGWTREGHLRRLPLHSFEGEENSLYEIPPTGELPARELAGGEELFVLSGRCSDELGVYPEGTWVRSPIGGAPPVRSEGGCRLYVKRGHLRRLPPSPRAG